MAGPLLNQRRPSKVTNTPLRPSGFAADRIRPRTGAAAVPDVGAGASVARAGKGAPLSGSTVEPIIPVATPVGGPAAWGKLVVSALADA